MALEREYKWLVEAAFPPLEALRPVLQGCGVDPVPLGERQQEDLYYDLPGGALRRRGIALRVRRFDGQTLATLKAPGRVQGSFHEREELEEPLVAPGHAGSVGWPTMIRERLAALAASQTEGFDLEALEPLLALSTHRRRVSLQRGALRLAELSFDTVSARRPHGSPSGESAQRAQFLELELEAYPGAPLAPLEEVAGALAAHFSFTPHTQDKVTHALTLLDRGRPSR